MLHEEHLDEEDSAAGFASPLIPKVDSFFLTSAEPQFGHCTLVELNTSFSNSAAHLLHLYS